MTPFLKSLMLGAFCMVGATLISCSSEDAGETLSVTFTSDASLVLARSKSGNLTSPETASEFIGITNVVAKVVYRGKETLVYKWTVSLPTQVAAVTSSTKETLKLDAKGTTSFKSTNNAGLPSYHKSLDLDGNGTPVAGESGMGSATLEVYESAGSQYKKATIAIAVIQSGDG